MCRLRSIEDARRVGECVVAAVSERHVAHAKVVILPQHVERVAKLMPAAQPFVSRLVHKGKVRKTYPSTPSREATLPEAKEYRSSATVLTGKKVWEGISLGEARQKGRCARHRISQ